jgi:hypothetical protein
MAFWENRERVSGFAHTHPGSGLPEPSHTDLTTFAAVEAGLGKRLNWFILTEDSFRLYRWKARPSILNLADNFLVARLSGVYDGPLYEADPIIQSSPENPMYSREPAWMIELRRLSEYR